MSSTITSFKCIVFTIILIQSFFVGVNCFSLRPSELFWFAQKNFSHSNAMILVSGTDQYFPAHVSGFGPPFHKSFTGPLVQARGDRFGCRTDDKTSSSEEWEYEGKILLVPGEDCSYATIVKQVQEAGGIAAILGPKTGPVKLSGVFDGGICHINCSDILDNALTIRIPSVSISLYSYESLSSLLQEHSSLDIAVFTPTKLELALTDLILFLGFLFAFVYIWVLLVLSVNRTRRSKRASTKDINSLPTRRWTREKYNKFVAGDISNTVICPGYHRHTHHDILLKCIICLENFAEDDLVMTLPCDHDFHKACLYCLSLGLSYI
jgi:hypothetical protein